MENFNLLTDQDQFYRDIHRRLIAPFPPGSVVQRENDPSSVYIRTDVYIARLNEAAGGFWSWRTTNQVIHEKEGLVQVNGSLKILHSEHEGIGFSNLQYFHDNRDKIRNLKQAVRSAAADGLRDACDQLQMGWLDLEKYRGKDKKRGNEQGHGTDVKCVVCQEELSKEERQYLADLKIRIMYCKKHIPAHLLRGK
jgi:hypothetical protein